MSFADDEYPEASPLASDSPSQNKAMPEKEKGGLLLKLQRRLTLQVILLVLLTCVIMGLAGYLVARRELGVKGEIILKNGVKMAMDIIKSYQDQVNSGSLTQEEAQKRVKNVLLGPRNPDGTREIRQKADLGENGYFIVYDVRGLELMHPTLEGQNKWEAVDPKNKDFLLVQDQIAKALNGGGFTWYNWMLPNSEKIARKVTYSELEPGWGWVVCASSYLIDFNRGANVILAFTMALTILSLILGIVLARHFIRSVTRPIGALLAGMRRAESCREEQGLTGRNDEIGSLVNGYNELIENITEARQKIRDNEKDLIKLAYHDTLSDLPNRNLFKTKVEADIAAAVSAGMLVVMDIRNFRLINTLQGESVGDGVLRMIGNILKDFQEESRTVGRISGDEFGIWLRGRDEAWLSRSVVMLQSQFASILQDMGYSQRVDVRVGYAMYPDDGSDFEHCYMSASLAVKRAKGMGGNAVVKFDETLRTSISRVEYLKQCLEKAIEEREFRMAYQEKVDPTGRLARSVEALARWVIPGEGPVSPAVFIPIIEEHGMITRFGELILELVMADFDKLRLKYGEDVSVSINVSPIHLFDANFSTKLFLEVRKHLVNPEHVILEITESMQIDDFERMKVIMSKIKEFGVRFSLDDFGTGYSSLSYIFRLPIAELKIDRAFVVSLDTDPNAIVMLGAICQMAKAYGLAIVAEGVETKEQEAYMLAQGVDLIQGYLYSKPEPV